MSYTPDQGVVAYIVIELNDKGQVTANGTIDNKMMALGLLETAKVAILERIKKMEEGGGRIVAPPSGMAQMLNKKGD